MNPWLTEEDVPVTCRCSAPGCVCERVDPELNWSTSSLLVCQECCLERHRYARHKGHRDIATTLRYIGKTPTALRGAADKLGEAMG